MYLVAITLSLQPIRKNMCCPSNTPDSDGVEALRAALSRPAGDLQHRPGLAVHQSGLHGRAARERGCDQHGWSRPGFGQRVHRALVVEREIRKRVLMGYEKNIVELKAGLTRYSDLPSPLATSVVREPHALGRVLVRPTTTKNNEKFWSKNLTACSEGRLWWESLQHENVLASTASRATPGGCRGPLVVTKTAHLNF